MPRKPASKKKAPSFEDALDTLENLVESMENDQLPLEELVSHYEQGAELLQHCENVLNIAKKRIEMIEISPPDENGLETSPSRPNDPPSATESRGREESDDIQLL